ncbi:MAG: Holliday junction branch migration protein RuvA [Deltaproteobacteria bacterium]|nr:Holliday junction branch migration protein RuvA [Deltaproteobacteria bacterium]MBW1912802.1 Holliday junction branch migration protein RuvA [Deltaproteobacteria bacterium]
MIARIKGVLLKKTTESIIIDIKGIGYEVIAPLSTFYAMPEEDEQVSLHIHTHVREDALILFGFKTTLEKKIFRLLISVSGIGPKLAINILSGMGPDELIDAIARGDAVRLQSIPGVGKKTAERMALELKDKAQKMRTDLEFLPSQVTRREDQMILDDALSALLNLGYPAKPAARAVEKAFTGIGKVSLEGVIRDALKSLA